MGSLRVALAARAADARDLFGARAPADLTIAELKALVGEGLTKTAFLEVVRACGDPSPDHKAWTTQKINESVARLAAKGVLSDDGVVKAAWEDRLTSRVALAPTGPALARRVRDASPKSWREGGGYQYYNGFSRPPHYDNDLTRATRLMALAGDAAQVERLIGIAEREATQDGHPMSMAPVLLRRLPARRRRRRGQGRSPLGRSDRTHGRGARLSAEPSVWAWAPAWESFQKRFSGPIEKGHGAQARQALEALVRPYLLRRTKAG